MCNTRFFTFWIACGAGSIHKKSALINSWLPLIKKHETNQKKEKNVMLCFYFFKTHRQSS